MFSIHRLWSLLATVGGAAVVLAGCGGSSSSMAGGSGDSAVELGPVSMQAQGKIGTPIGGSSASISVTGLAGASFNKVQVNLPPLDQTNVDVIRKHSRIVYILDAMVYMYDYGKKESYRLLSTEEPYRVHEACFLGKTNKVVLRVVYGYASSYFATINADGTGFQILNLPALGANYGISGSPDGTRFAAPLYDNGLGTNCLYVINASTGVAKRITSGPNDVQPEWLPDGRIVFLRYNANWTASQPHIVNPDGTGLATAGPSQWDMSDISVSPGLKSFVALFHDGTNQYLLRYPFERQGDGSAIPIGSYAYGHVDWAPDGNVAAYSYLADSGYKLVTTDFSSSASVPLLDNVLDFDWSPYLDKWLFVGTGSILMPKAAGVLFSQSGKDVISLLAFDATTATTARITKLSEGGEASNLVFDLAADKIRSLRYVNSLQSMPVTVVNSTNSATYVGGAVVSIDAQTGEVASIVTYNGTATAARLNGKVVLQGDLVDRWDHIGQRQSLQGQKDLRIDP